MTRNPVLVEPIATGLRALFLPEDDRSKVTSGSNHPWRSRPKSRRGRTFL
jgi:hypothetical protein